MRRAAILIAFSVLLLTGSVTGQQKRQQDIDLQAAIRTETVEGNLRAAIKQFEAVASKYHADHMVTVQALMHMAACYEKSGQADAREVYARIVRDYSDQTEAVTFARIRLGSESRPDSNGMILRRVWADQYVDNEGAVSADGRYVSFPDWSTGDLAVRELTTGTNYRLTQHENPGGNYREYAEESSISRDGSQIAYSWFNGTDRYELRMLPLHSSSTGQPRRVYDNPDVLWMAPYEWTPDGKWISVQIQRKDRTAQIGLVSSLDGSLRVLKSVTWRGTSRVFMSPDGKYLAYDLPASDSAMTDRDVFVMAVDGSRESRAISGPGQNRVMGFAPDGSWLLFASDRRGSFGLWSVALNNGRVEGQPVLIKQDFPHSSLGITKTGTLFAFTSIGNADVQVASVDLQSGKALSGPTPVANRFLGTNILPDWSPDGKRLAFVSNRDIGHNNRVIVVRDEDTGKMRELQPELDYFGPPRWTPDSRGILVKGIDLKGHESIFRIDADSGETLLLAPNAGSFNAMAQMSPDGKKLYMWTSLLPGSEGATFVERDLASGTNRELFRDHSPVWFYLSPDGQYLSGTTNEERTGESSLQLIRVGNGVRRELFRTRAPESLRQHVAWSPDSRAIIVRQEQNGNGNFLIIPLVGGEPRKLELSVTDLYAGLVRVHPDGRRLAFSAGRGRAELWRLENFLLASPAAK